MAGSTASDRERAHGSAAPGGRALSAAAPLSALRGIGPKLSQRLAAQGLCTVRDLLWLFPRRYQDVAAIAGPAAEHVGSLVRFRAVVLAVQRQFLPGRRSRVVLRARAANGEPCEVAFFNQPYLVRAWQPGQDRLLEGTLARRGRRFVLAPGRVIAPDAEADVPLLMRYPAVDGVSETRLRRLIQTALAQLDPHTLPDDDLPASLAVAFGDVADAVRAMHLPADGAEHEAARRRFALAEAVGLFAVMERARALRQGRAGVPVRLDDVVEQRLAARIPFPWTADQAAAVDAIRRALGAGPPMGMLLQGDVGTGKTAVALWAALAVIASGHQAAFLAPTELLAEQHHADFVRLLAGSRVCCALLAARGGATERRAVEAAAASGEAQLIVGTHALLSERARLPRLGLAIIDEQHRFGVRQREALLRKGSRHPHVLVLTATPIPRTLTLALFGDLDVAVLTQRPNRRPPPRALALPGPRAWDRVRRAIARRARRGQGTFVVCPSVGEDGVVRGTVETHARIARHFSAELVHGRMPAVARQAAVERFRRGEVDVLVGTTVLEVGVDVARATLMVVVDAHRFGLATLHQLRGRVGRGARAGLCLLLGDDNERARAVCATRDGFALAETDLHLRGSGEILGLRQSGLGELRAFDPATDLELLLRARQAVASALP